MRQHCALYEQQIGLLRNQIDLERESAKHLKANSEAVSNQIYMVS